MDSGNSGSFQSSSGEEEFDSQTDGISALLNNNQAADHVVAHSNHHQQPPLPLPPETPSSSYMYHNPSSNYFDLVSPPTLPPPRQPLQNHHLNNTLLINSDVDWLKTLRSQTDQITSFQSLLGIQNPVDENTTTDAGILVSPPPPQPPTPTTANINAGKNPRKRSRASRRAPTTVLTTDTSNFRAMVQEFTGIPAAPPFTFTSASAEPFTRNRFDLFGGRASHSHLISRPFPQKVQLGSSSSIIDHAIIASSNSNNNTFGFGMNINANNPTYNYFNVPNPIVSSFLEPNTSGFPASSTKSHQESLDISPNDSHMKMGGGLDEYSCRVNTNTHSGVPNLIYSEDQTTIRIGNNNQDGVSWQNIGVNSSQDDDQINFNFSS